MPEGFKPDLSKAVGHRYPDDFVSQQLSLLSLIVTYIYKRWHVLVAITYCMHCPLVFLKLSYDGSMRMVLDDNKT